jgi:hypothetical protein
MTVGRTEAVAAKVVTAETSLAMVSVEVVTEKPVVAVVSPPNAGISLTARNIYHDTGPGEDSLKPIMLCAANYNKLAL